MGAKPRSRPCSCGRGLRNGSTFGDEERRSYETVAELYLVHGRDSYGDTIDVERTIERCRRCGQLFDSKIRSDYQPLGVSEYWRLTPVDPGRARELVENPPSSAEEELR